MKVEARALWTTENQDSAFIGARSDSDDTRFYPIWYYDGALSYGHKEWKPLSEAKVPANSVVDIVSDFTTAGQATIKVGDSEYKITGLGDAFDTGLTMYLGALNYGGSVVTALGERIGRSTNKAFVTSWDNVACPPQSLKTTTYQDHDARSARVDASCTFVFVEG